MAPALDDTSDVVDPMTEDWTLNDDGAVYQAAVAGIPPAIAEARRRSLAGPF